MAEVVSRPDESDNPLREQEYWVLELLDFTESWRPGFLLQQRCGHWCEINGQFIFDKIELEELSQLANAQRRYNARRLALVKAGFVHSDMDF